MTWINGLVNGDGTFKTHIIRDATGNPLIDQTLHWAAPNQDCIDGTARTDCRGASAAPYIGPMPMVTHVHGAHVGPVSDGYPEAWWLPNATNLVDNGDGTVTDTLTGSIYDPTGTFYDDINGGAPGTARPYTSTPTTSPPPPSGTTTTPWALRV